MEGIIKVKTPQEGFVKHVFDFGDESKSEVMNSIQYLAVSFIPVLLASHVLNKLFKEIGSGNNNVKAEETSSVQLLAEVLIQLFLLYDNYCCNEKFWSLQRALKKGIRLTLYFCALTLAIPHAKFNYP